MIYRRFGRHFNHTTLNTLIMKINCIQHVAFEGLGNIQEWIDNNGHSLNTTKLFLNAPLPNPEDFDMLIIMGGPMGVYDEDKYEWVALEKQLIKATIAQNKPILGVCLGSQFIASALGAKVYPGPMKEIGWFPIHVYNKEWLTFENDNPVVFHWHGDTFDLPESAQLMASTPEVPNQAYVVNNNVIGLQFHLEQTPTTLKGMIEHCGEELNETGLKIQAPQLIGSETSYFEKNKQVIFKLLDKISTL